MRLIFSILTALVVLAAALFFIGPLLISTDAVREQLLAKVESATGYRLRIDGPVKFSLFPSLDLVAQDVGVAQSGAEIAKAKTLRFGLVWSALWGGQVQLTEVTLIDPVIAVPAKQQQSGGGGSPSGQARANERSLAATLRSLTLDKLVVENGTVIMPPSARGPGKRIERLNLEASLPSFDGPLAFDVDAAYDGKPIQAAGSIGQFGPFLSGTASAFDAVLDIPAHHRERITLTGSGSLQNDDTLFLKPFTAKTANAVVTGDASYKNSLLTLHPFTATIYGNTLSGSLAANLAGNVPAVNAALSTDILDLNKLLAGLERQRADLGSEVRRTLAELGSGVISPARANPNEVAVPGWSDKKIDFSPLNNANAKLKLTAKQLLYGNLKINPGTMQATLTGGKLNAEFPSFALYNGTGAASLAVDASAPVPSQRVRLSLANFEAYPFLKDAAGFHNIEGTGALSLDVSAAGTSQRAMIQTASGAAKFNFTNGAIRGINVAKAVRNLSTGTMSGWQDSANEKTDFATLAASFQMANGQAQTNDLQLTGPMVRMSGAGNVNLPARTLAFRVDPKIMASLEGQEGQADLQGLGVPVLITGPWARPRIYPDIKGILENPVAAYEQLNKLNQLGGGLVKLPGVDELGEKAGVSGVPLSNVIKDGKIDKEALQQGLGQLLNKDNAKKAPPPPPPPAAGAAETAAEPVATTAPAAAPAPKDKPKAEAKKSDKDKKDAKDKKQASSEERSDAKPKSKAEQKQQQKKEQKRETEEAAKQMLQDLFGN